jgi:hypothetical protein
LEPREKVFLCTLIALYVVCAIGIGVKYIITPKEARELTFTTVAAFGDPSTPENLQKVLETGQFEVTMQTTNGGVETRRVQIAKNDGKESDHQLQKQIMIETGKTKHGYRYHTCQFSRIITVNGVGYTTIPISFTESSAKINNTYAPGESSRDLVILDAGRFAALEKVDVHATSKPGQLSQITVLELCLAARHSGAFASVTAVEFGESEEPETLLSILEDLLEQKIVTALPVAALLTPGGSANTIVDWILYGDVDILTTRVAQHWISVSAPTVLHVTADEDDDGTAEVDKRHVSTGLQKSRPTTLLQHWPMLAMYGRDDEKGRRAAETLQTQFHATVTELAGGHSFYTELPRDFSKAVIDYLEPKFSKKERMFQEITFQV